MEGARFAMRSLRDERLDTATPRSPRNAVMPSALRRLCALVMLALVLTEIRRRGPLIFRAPSTVLSNSHPGQPSPDAYLLFLGEAGRRLPRGAVVAVVPQRQGELATGARYLMAVAQMPDQNVVPPTTLRALDAPRIPEWVVSYGAVFEDSRFRLAAAIPGGALYRAVP